MDDAITVTKGNLTDEELGALVAVVAELTRPGPNATCLMTDRSPSAGNRIGVPSVNLLCPARQPGVDLCDATDMTTCFVLASKSPARLRMLRSAGIEPVVIASGPMRVICAGRTRLP
ncbi:septum formation protein Maf [Cutibacterium acnes JCM 18916]|nr:septum formation protein Maf [Cutibacterium acnes JCM 18909]GAE73766.1 septum formation protein Maf [Cutibacterium acnes JCM 18916]